MRPITIYTALQRNGMPCPYCRRAVALLTRKGLVFTEIDLTGKPEERMKLAVKASGATTVPQVFIGGEYVGDCDELQVLEARGRLNTLVAVQ